MQILNTYKSKSGNGVHEVRMANDCETIYCTCWGWKKNRTCWHLEDYLSHFKHQPKREVTCIRFDELNENDNSDRLQLIIEQEIKRLTS